MSNNQKESSKLVSIVIPCYNEEKNIERFDKELFPVLDKLPYEYEVIAVDDGSQKDKTWETLRKVAKNNPKFKALKHSRNYGMGAAYQTAFDKSKGDYVITYSADLEISPEYIAEVVKKMDEGYDMVNTHRTGRWQGKGFASLLRTIPSKMANKLIINISGVDVKDTGSGLKGFKRFIIDNLRIYGDMHRFLPAYSGLYTKRITEFEVDYQDRTYGKSAYGSIKRTFAVFLDLFSMKFMLSFATKPFSMMPGRIFGTLGMGAFGLGGVIGVYLAFVKIILGQPIGNRPLLLGGVVLIIAGIQLIMTGMIGELLMRTYFESSGKKVYIVSEKEN